MSRFAVELAELVDQFCEGDIAPEQATRLETLVAESVEARQYVLDCFQVHCDLAWEFGREGESVMQWDTQGSASPPCGSEPAREQRRVWHIAAIAVATLLAVSLGLVSIVHRSGPAAPPAQSVAHIVHMGDVRWNGPAPQIDAPLAVGSKLNFQDGRVEVAFESGARISIQGPAEVKLQSSSIVLPRGNVTAQVPVEAQGFAIHTPNSTVVDLGTKFVVDCQAGQTYVEVFEGMVVLRLDDTQSGGTPQVLPLAAKNAVRVNGVPGHGALRIEQLTAGSRHFSAL
jgi:hypothetical protein